MRVLQLFLERHRAGVSPILSSIIIVSVQLSDFSPQFFEVLSSSVTSHAKISL